jgi:hypothetical protein
MSSMQSEVFEAFRAIDIPEDKALTAAAALSGRDNDVVTIKRDLAVSKWLVVGLYPLLLAVLLRLFLR